MRASAMPYTVTTATRCARRCAAFTTGAGNPDRVRGCGALRTIPRGELHPVDCDAQDDVRSDRQLVLRCERGEWSSPLAPRLAQARRGRNAWRAPGPVRPLHRPGTATVTT